MKTNFDENEISGELAAEQLEKVIGGTGAFEINDFSFGVENPTTIGSATGGAGSGKVLR